MSIAGKLTELREAVKTLAANITAKGVAASESDGLVTLAAKVSQIPSGISLDGDRIVSYAFDGSGGKGAEFASAERATAVTWTLSGYHAWGIYMDSVTSVPRMPFNAAAVLPVELSFKALAVTPVSLLAYTSADHPLRKIWLGVVTTLNYRTWYAPLNNLRYVEVGEGTDISLNFYGSGTTTYGWFAANVIAEGETACLELIAGARTGIVERVKDHTGEVDARTLTMPWVATLLESEHESVQTALALLMADASAKGWSIAG